MEQEADTAEIQEAMPGHRTAERLVHRIQVSQQTPPVLKKTVSLSTIDETMDGKEIERMPMARANTFPKDEVAAGHLADAIDRNRNYWTTVEMVGSNNGIYVLENCGSLLGIVIIFDEIKTRLNLQ
ncbi:hypothetical protein QE152_g7127 [Popillia japonica]|uniref:Uncharacterized protein n=1 Tax=Popillia japonica TaxID=7064 RepID=A0AAW1MG42_POPJA